MLNTAPATPAAPTAPSPTDQKIAALQQRYSKSQQLIDLLALQKLKQEKDAAARDMQMKAAQQMGGAGIPTVKDQLENEMVGRSKQEVTEQLNTIAAQKQQQQQDALQRVAESGIAQNPVSMNLAGGGIVAFAGPEGSYVEGEETEEQKLERLTKELARLRGMGPSRPSVSARGGAREPSALQRGIAGIGQSIRNVFTPREEKIKQLEAQIAAQRGTVGDGFEAIARTVGDMPSAMPQGQPQPAAPRGPAPQGPAMQPPAAPQGPAMQPPAAPAAPGSKLNEGLGNVIADMLKQNPMQEADQEEQYRQSRLDLTPQQRGVYEQGIAAAQRRMQEMSDPERINREARIRGQLAAAGGGGFAAYGAGDLNAREQQRLALKQAEEDYAKAAEGLVGIERANTLKALESRDKSRELASKSREEGVRAATNIYQVDRQAEVAGLDRDSRKEIAEMQVAAQREANRLQAEYNNSIKSDSQYRTAVDSMNRYSDAAAKPFDRMIENLMETISLSGKPTPEQQTQLNNLRKARDLAVQNIRDQYEPMLNKYNPEGGGGGFKVIGSRPGK